MIFNKKRNKMIDIRELQKRGVVRIPKKEIVIPTNDDGFVELNRTKSQEPKTKSSNSNADFFGFMGNNTTETSNNRNTERPSEHARLTDLDNKIYKLEQRIELLERKLDVNQSTNAGPLGW
jgi:hypothetical protein